jgi:hypothetical protein
LPLSPVYTTTFIGAQGVTSSVSYQVPAGFTAIVTSCQAYGDFAVATNLNLHGLAGQTVWHVGAGAAQGKIYSTFEGRVAYGEGTVITVVVENGQAWDITVSGYLLTDTPA